MQATGCNVTVEELWSQCQSEKISLVAKRHGVTRQQMVGDFIEAGLLGNRASDPSPSQIADRTALIRAAWTPAQEHARWIAARRHEDSGIIQGG
jgi:hypothetical protein